MRSTSTIPGQTSLATTLATQDGRSIHTSVTHSTQTPAMPSMTSQPTPTDRTFELLPTDSQLSPGEKAAIIVSVVALLSILLVFIGFYIRRLKRELRAAQAQVATGAVSEAEWRAHTPILSEHGFAAERRESGRTASPVRGRSSPVSPLSPLDRGGEWMKRGRVLSVVVERSSEDELGDARGTWEPVPGQREGIASALELDGERTGIVEMPISITPRMRSRERERQI
ncbi:hypothetical protein M011DRAFT_484778 [Sporormia fimetaria CBS 119925]|uniref:Uncharacterized protein n=1 Tax=Sporormia fimetaria CBS 119925 TaxID=1340428 RepID=A0A6A6VJN7_9PLEO|nr:hypothetical protein M011DRAFT_484778 [Sporormia fimetaria CBS 119925]